MGKKLILTGFVLNTLFLVIPGGLMFFTSPIMGGIMIALGNIFYIIGGRALRKDALKQQQKQNIFN